jgi:hypothetical protein
MFRCFEATAADRSLEFRPYQKFSFMESWIILGLLNWVI